MLTIKKIEKAMKEMFGIDIHISKGTGYYWYYTDIPTLVNHFEDNMVMVNSLNQFTLEEWLSDFAERADKQIANMIAIAVADSGIKPKFAQTPDISLELTNDI